MLLLFSDTDTGFALNLYQSLWFSELSTARACRGFKTLHSQNVQGFTQHVLAARAYM
jgi:hypothetical protein